MESPRASLVVLSADGNQRRNEELSQRLAACGWTVIPHSDSQSARTALSTESVRLAILALDSPIDALAVARDARAAGRLFHCVFVDSHKRPEVGQACLALGAIAYLVRPLSEQTLAEVLRRAETPPSGVFVNGEFAGEDAPGLLGRLSPGKRVRVNIRSGPSVGTYEAMVIEVGPAAVVISAWGADGSQRYVSLGTAVTVGFADVQGWGEFESTVMGSYVQDALLHITLRRPSRVSYRQRRRCERMGARLPMRAWVVGESSRAISGHTENLSMEGVAGFLRGALPQRERFRVAVSPSAWQPEIRLPARAVWWERLGDNYQGWHRCGFQFDALSSRIRQALGDLLAQRFGGVGRDEAVTGALPGRGFALPAQLWRRGED